jgi:hypothetical protein
MKIISVRLSRGILMALLGVSGVYEAGLVGSMEYN